MANTSSKKLKTLLFLLTVSIIISTLTFLPMPDVNAETKIISITPSQGYVGTTVQLKANITTPNGLFQIRFDGEAIISGNATENIADILFKIPSAPAGNHNVTIFDVENATESDPVVFTVLTLYSLKTYAPKSPMQLQEGDSIKISLNITGGDRNKTYFANVTVQTPTNASYYVMWNASTDNKGEGLANITYPDDFKPVNSEANTNFTGEYKVFSNVTTETESFFIELTNSTEYHRFDYVDIKATGYQPNENVTVTISFDGKTLNSTIITAVGGVIHYTNWTVPSNASIGIYTVNIASTSNRTTKKPLDIQNFTVPGFGINLTTRNLAEEPVANVTVRAFEYGKSVVNATSNSEGLATVMLEIGNYTCEAYFKNRKVGETSMNITESSAWEIRCNLTNLRIHVIDEAGICIPKVKIYQTPDNETLFTDINGTRVMHSLLPNVTYTLNFSRYDMVFNTTIIPQLTTTAWFNITVLCPSVTLQVNVTDANGQPIDKAMVKIQDVMGGLYYEKNTDKGIAITNCTLGNYTIEVYMNEVKLNSTLVELFQNQNVSIHCNLYGLNISVKVIDYFGQPIPNVNVTLQREGLQPISGLTQADGVVTFNNKFKIGGNVQITIYLNGQTQPCGTTTSYVDKSTTLEVKIQKYVILAGFLVETSQLAITIIIVATVVLALLLEIYRRKRVKSHETKTENK